jgi:hypothetical protein
MNYSVDWDGKGEGDDPNRTVWIKVYATEVMNPNGNGLIHDGVVLAWAPQAGDEPDWMVALGRIRELADRELKNR